MTPAAAALGDLFEDWRRRRLAEVRALLASGVAPGGLGARMDPPASPAAAEYYCALVGESRARGELPSSHHHSQAHPAPAARLAAPLLLSSGEAGG